MTNMRGKNGNSHRLYFPGSKITVDSDGSQAIIKRCLLLGRKATTNLVKVKSLSRVQTLQPCGLKPTRLFHPWDFPGKNTGVGCHFLLQEIFLTQGLNSGLPHYRQTLCHLSHQGSPQHIKSRDIISPTRSV